MCYNRSDRSDRRLQLNWIAIGDQAKSLRSNWSLEILDGSPGISVRDLVKVCNDPVTEKCETSLTRARQGSQARAVTMCGI
jgi:hypothetical protein